MNNNNTSMALPDTEELIKKINTLTLDKNRLRQKLTQLSQGGAAGQPQQSKDSSSSMTTTNNYNSQHSSSSSSSSCNTTSITTTTTTTPPSEDSASQQAKATSNNSGGTSKLNSPKLNKSLSGDHLFLEAAILASSSSSSNSTRIANQCVNSNNGANIAGIECATSCEDDLMYVIDLYRRKLNEYNDNWDFIQSKCTALMAELKALQEHYAMLKKEKMDLQEKYDSKCDEVDQIKGELQTVVLNYETQLSAMSEHLSMITSQP